jgi:hypothetical protein
VYLHDLMLAAGYDPTRDTWAVNEVGWPSDNTVSTDVIDGAPGARTGFEDFVHGLHDGSSGPPMAGLVFAANPAQLANATSLWQYERKLAAWYSDTPFWEAMQRDVRFWAQETYADARAWGVDGSPAAARAASLNEYFLHATRLATGAARTFLESAYAPLGNATYRTPAPSPDVGPGFGFTAVPVPDMLNFVSTQTYALRLSTPSSFGFAINASKDSNAAWNMQIYQRIAASVRDSQTDPAGACEATGESCAGVVAGAAFPTTWPRFATPPAIVPHVAGIRGDNGWYTGDVTVTWDVVDDETPDTVSSSGCEPVTIAADTTGTTITCSAASSGGSALQSVQIARDATPPTLACAPTPSTLWPPNGKLVPVDVSVSLADATSGADGFELTAAPPDGASGFVLGTPDVSGLLLARRPGKGGDLVYTLTYTARDHAGNSATCDAAVTVPHDERP